ncbi:TPA: hypothetical protein ACRZZI_004950 [Vibrio harveyi]
MAKFGIERDFFMMTPEAFLAIGIASRQRGEAAALISHFMSALVAWCDENGEVEASAAVIAQALDVHRNAISKVTKNAVDNGFLEYHLRRGKRGNLYRLNPELFCVIPKVKHVNAESVIKYSDGEIEKTNVIRKRKEERYVKLLKSYKGKSLQTSEVIAQVKKLRSMVCNSNSAIPLH